MSRCTRTLVPSETAMPADSCPRCWSEKSPKYVRLATSTPCFAQIPKTPHMASDALRRSAAYSRHRRPEPRRRRAREGAHRVDARPNARRSRRRLQRQPAGLAPGRLGREDARNFRRASLGQSSFPSLTDHVERQPELALELDRVATGETEQ